VDLEDYAKLQQVRAEQITHALVGSSTPSGSRPPSGPGKGMLGGVALTALAVVVLVIIGVISSGGLRRSSGSTSSPSPVAQPAPASAIAPSPGAPPQGTAPPASAPSPSAGSAASSGSPSAPAATAANGTTANGTSPTSTTSAPVPAEPVGGPVPGGFAPYSATFVITALGTGGGMVYVSVSGCPAAGGTGCSTSTVVYAASVGADRFSPVSPTLAGGGERGLVVQGADWYLALPGGIYHGHGNAAPTQLPNPCPQYPNNPETPAVAVADAEHLDAMCAGGGAPGSASYQLFGTTDGGQHWTKAGPTHMEASGLFGVADH